MTAQSKWIWDGHAGHYVLADRCQFHMNTRVGDFIVSTVGEYQPENPNRRTNGEQYGGKDYAAFETVGAGRLFETFVFKANLNDEADLVPPEWTEIDALPANDHDTARRNHMTMARRYSRRRQDGY